MSSNAIALLTDAHLSGITVIVWMANYRYKNGDMASRTIQSETGTFSYNGHQMKSAIGDENLAILGSLDLGGKIKK